MELKNNQEAILYRWTKACHKKMLCLGIQPPLVQIGLAWTLAHLWSLAPLLS